MGIDKTKYLAYLHVDHAINILKEMKNDTNKEIYKDILSAIYYVLTRNKWMSWFINVFQ